MVRGLVLYNVPDYMARDMGVLREPASMDAQVPKKMNSLVPYTYRVPICVWDSKRPMHVWDVPYAYGSSHTREGQNTHTRHNMHSYTIHGMEPNYFK